MRSPITEWSDSNFGSPFQVPLLEKLVSDSLAPPLALLPGSTRVADVGAFERNLEDEEARLGTSQVDLVRLDSGSEIHQILLVTRDVRR